MEGIRLAFEGGGVEFDEEVPEVTKLLPSRRKRLGTSWVRPCAFTSEL